MPVVIILGEGQDVLASLLRQLGRQDQEICSDSIQGGVEIFFGKTESFEPMNNIVSQEKNLKEGHIGNPVLRGDLAEGIIVEEFADILLDGGPLGVELPDSPGMSLHIGDQDMVGIFSILEEGQLPGLYGVFGNRASDHDETMWGFPSERLVSKLPCFPAMAELFEATSLGSGFDGGILPGYNSIATSDGVEELDDASAKEPRIGPNANAASGNIGGNLFQTMFEKWHYAGTGCCISRPQAAMPELLEMGLETQQRMIGASAPFLGIVTDFGKLGLPIDCEDHRVQIEDQRGSGFGYSKQPGAKLVVQGDELADGLGGKPLEESPQCRLIWKPGESQHGEENSIVLQDLGLVDAPQARHDSIEESDDQIGGEIVGIALRNLNGPLNQSTESELVAKTLKDYHSSEVSETGIFECEMQYFQAFGHDTELKFRKIYSLTQTVQNGRFVSDRNYNL